MGSKTWHAALNMSRLGELTADSGREERACIKDLPSEKLLIVLGMAGLGCLRVGFDRRGTGTILFTIL